jgi:hypothetical protein
MTTTGYVCFEQCKAIRKMLTKLEYNIIGYDPRAHAERR